MQRHEVADEVRRLEMLDAYVIEEIKRREREREERPSIELPVPPPAAPSRDGGRDDDRKDDRGVVIIDYSG